MADDTKPVKKMKKRSATEVKPSIHTTIRHSFTGKDGTVQRRLYVAGDEDALVDALDVQMHRRLTRAGHISGFAVPEK